MSQSHVRLFLSVDVAGSTRLKNIRNHKDLLNRYEERYEVLASFNTSALQSDQRIPDGELKNQVIASLARTISRQTMDWAVLLTETFRDLNTTFQGNIERLNAGPSLRPQAYPWKALGDELVYAIEVTKREQIHQCICAFLGALRLHDEKLAKEKLIRLKGSAWVAGFPVRNRIVELPVPEVIIKGSGKGYPFPRQDFLGPDMDIGFRLGKCTWPGFIVGSMGLVELLGDYKTHSQIRVHEVGWESLKGVWDGRPYPIFWLSMPKESEISDTEYFEYREGDEVESQFLKSWIGKGSRGEEAKEHREKIKKIRKEQSDSLGLVTPYLVQEDGTENIPEDHKRILEIMKALQDQSEDGSDNAPWENPGGKTTIELSENVDQVFNNFTR